MFPLYSLIVGGLIINTIAKQTFILAFFCQTNIQSQLSCCNNNLTRSLTGNYLSIACIFVRIKVFSFSHYRRVHVARLGRRELRNADHVIITWGRERRCGSQSHESSDDPCPLRKPVNFLVNGYPRNNQRFFN